MASTSIKVVATQCWRIYYLNPTADVANKLREFILLTGQVFGWMVKLSYFQYNTEGERQVAETWLHDISVTAKRDEQCDLFYFCLQDQPLMLPNDIGLFRVAPKGTQTASYIKTTKGMVDLNTPLTRKRYYRLSDKVFFPDGIYSNQTEMNVTVAATNDTDMIPNDLVPDIIKQVLSIYNPNQKRNEDATADTVDTAKA